MFESNQQQTKGQPLEWEFFEKENGSFDSLKLNIGVREDADVPLEWFPMLLTDRFGISSKERNRLTGENYAGWTTTKVMA